MVLFGCVLRTLELFKKKERRRTLNSALEGPWFKPYLSHFLAARSWIGKLNFLILSLLTCKTEQVLEPNHKVFVEIE